jgi:hypothetical protein
VKDRKLKLEKALFLRQQGLILKGTQTSGTALSAGKKIRMQATSVKRTPFGMDW